MNVQVSQLMVNQYFRIMYNCSLCCSHHEHIPWTVWRFCGSVEVDVPEMYKQAIKLVDVQLKESYKTKLMKPWGLLKHIPHILQKYKYPS